MSFFESTLFMIALMAITAFEAQELEPMGDISAEPVETQTANDEKMTTESLNSWNDSMAEESSEETTERITLLLEEMDPNERSSESSVVETVTGGQTSEGMITSEYNGFDLKSSGSEFSCFGRSFGQYADVDKECRVFHLCYPYFNSTTDELLYQRITFLCDNDSVFDQKKFICVDNSTVGHKCADSESLYKTTNQEYLIRVFSQSVSPIDAVKGQTEAEEVKPSSSPSWFNWFYSD